MGSYEKNNSDYGKKFSSEGFSMIREKSDKVPLDL